MGKEEGDDCRGQTSRISFAARGRNFCPFLLASGSPVRASARVQVLAKRLAAESKCRTDEIFPNAQ